MRRDVFEEVEVLQMMQVLQLVAEADAMDAIREHFDERVKDAPVRLAVGVR